jgi:hypothetical protein
VNQNAVVNTALKAGNIQEVVTVTENASLLNTSTAEVSTRFDERRLSELPIAPNRNVLNVLLSVPGVSQLGGGQSSYATGLSFSANGVVRRMGPVQFCYLHTTWSGADISSKPQVSYPPKSAELQDRPQSGPYVHVHVLGTCEDELLGERAVWVSYLKTVAGFDLLARLLADQRRLRVLVIIPGLLFLSVNQYHRVWVEVFTYHDQLLARDRCHSYSGRRDEGVTELHAVE